MKRLLTTGIHLMMTIQPGGVVCHVARAAEFVYPMIATGQWLISWPGTRGRDYCIYGGRSPLAKRAVQTDNLYFDWDNLLPDFAPPLSQQNLGSSRWKTWKNSVPISQLPLPPLPPTEKRGLWCLFFSYPGETPFSPWPAVSLLKKLPSSARRWRQRQTLFKSCAA